jgi:S-DNA-T family DNA segregation ATPase FtsK/SpoIIIE
MMNEPHVTDLSSLDDMEEFIARVKEELDLRRSQLIQCRMSGGNLAELMNEWSQIVFVIDRLSELTSGMMYNFNELLERIVKQERGMKVAIIAADNTGDLASNWDSLGKAIREEQTGVLLGRMRDQSLYSTNLPYGVQEQITEQGDGYMIVKHKYTGLRYAMHQQYTLANMTACR